MLNLIAIAVVVVSVGITLYFWRRSEHIAAILMDGAKGYEELRQKNMRLESAILNFENQVVELKRKDDQNRKSLSQTSAANLQNEQKFAEQTQDLERRMRNVIQQRDHILNAHETLQIKYDDLVLKVEELTNASIGWATERTQLKQTLEGLDSQTIVKLKAELAKANRTVQDLDRELKQLKSKEVISPREFDTLRRRAGHYERLYTGMKGLRDMVDERNKNWEDALSKMARWILTSSSVAQPGDPILNQSIGPVVGEALERIGASMVEVDDQSQLPDHFIADQELRAGALSDKTGTLSV